MATTNGDFIEEDYDGEMEDVIKLVNKLSKIFPKVNIGVEFIQKIDKYQIMVDDYDFYMKDSKFRVWIKILSNKYSKLRFFTAYRNIID